MDINEYMRECEEDDLFYAKLREQILLLTADDDDDDAQELQKRKLQVSVKTLHQRFNNSSAASALQHGCYYNWSGRDEATETAPAWLFNLWKSGNGTGVFIPQIVKSRTRNKPRRKNYVRGSTYKPVAIVKS